MAELKRRRNNKMPGESVPLTQDQILAQLMVRGFEEGFQRTPLREFVGKLSSITGEMRQGSSGSYAVALYNFDEVEVLEAVEPYNSPAAQIEVSVSTRSKSAMGYFGKSIDNIINAGLPLDAPMSQVKNQSYIIGKTIRVKLTPGHIVPRKDEASGKWEDKPIDCWELLEVRGLAGKPATVNVGSPITNSNPTVNANQQALLLLEGKTEQQWHQAVFINPIVKGDMAVIQSIINRTFLSGLEGAGKVSKGEDGVYHIVP